MACMSTIMAEIFLEFTQFLQVNAGIVGTLKFSTTTSCLILSSALNMVICIIVLCITSVVDAASLTYDPSNFILRVQVMKLPVV